LFGCTPLKPVLFLSDRPLLTKPRAHNFRHAMVDLQSCGEVSNRVGISDPL
jgi:hypothetical protein